MRLRLGLEYRLIISINSQVISCYPMMLFQLHVLCSVRFINYIIQYIKIREIYQTSIKLSFNRFSGM